MSLTYYHNDCLFAHPSRTDHPERPHRLAAALSGLLSLKGVPTRRGVSRSASADLPALLHDAGYIERLREHLEPDEFDVMDGGDTTRTATSYPAALEALGSAVEAIDGMVAGQHAKAMVLGRPAGHHACKDKAMGFCLIGQAAIAAKYAAVHYGMRVAVLDFVLLHGNGTQDLLWDEGEIFFASSHEAGIWPFSGMESETGAHGQILNKPLANGTGSTEARQVWQDIFDRVRDFSPDLLIVSAGFDAHGNDPLSGLNWQLDDYTWLGDRISGLSELCANGRVLSVLEGGYDLQVLRAATNRYLCGLLGCQEDLPDVFRDVSLMGNGSPYFKGLARELQRGNGFEVLKRNGRLWICDSDAGLFLYTPPGFLMLRSRDPLKEICREAGETGDITIGSIIDLECRTERVFGYTQRHSLDFRAY
jgi:acetoin utilization deacetylase AcuC-like enzyme